MTLRIIGGELKGRLLKTPKHQKIRPTQSFLREALFNICQHEIKGAKFLDLFAGSGAVGFEAISRGASHCTMVENHRQAIRCIRENIQSLHLEKKTTFLPVDIHKGISLLKKKEEKFDLIFLDPPYEISFELNPLIELVHPHTLIFIEEKYSFEKKGEKRFLPLFLLKKQKRFHDTLLSIICHLPKNYTIYEN